MTETDTNLPSQVLPYHGRESLVHLWATDFCVPQIWGQNSPVPHQNPTNPDPVHRQYIQLYTCVYSLYSYIYICVYRYIYIYTYLFIIIHIYTYLYTYVSHDIPIDEAATPRNSCDLLLSFTHRDLRSGASTLYRGSSKSAGKAKFGIVSRLGNHLVMRYFLYHKV